MSFVLTLCAVALSIALPLLALAFILRNPRPSDYDENAIKRYNIERMKKQMRDGK